MTLSIIVATLAVVETAVIVYLVIAVLHYPHELAHAFKGTLVESRTNEMGVDISAGAILIFAPLFWSCLWPAIPKRTPTTTSRKR